MENELEEPRSPEKIMNQFKFEFMILNQDLLKGKKDAQIHVVHYGWSGGFGVTIKKVEGDIFLPVSMANHISGLTIKFSKGNIYNLSKYKALGYLTIRKSNIENLNEVLRSISLSSHHRLNSITLDDMGLNDFPDVSSLNNLKSLSLNRNMIKTIPKYLENISINRLFLNQNRIQSIPDQIDKFSISHLFLENNPIESINPNLQGTKIYLKQEYI